MRDVLTNLNHQPIEFYGRVLDQFNEPVRGAEVQGQIIYNTGVTSGVEKPTAFTDENGYFQFKGFNGRTLDFSIVKAGYQFTPEGDAFDYTRLVPEEKRHHPDPHHPIVVKMWKLQGAEPLIQGGQFIRIIPDGNGVRIDLQNRRIVETGGDLIVSLKHDRQSPKSVPKAPYDWRAEIKMVNGGFVEVDQRIDNMLLAPEEGYAADVIVDMPATRQNWTPNVTKNYYAKLRGSLYSRLQLNIQCSPRQPASGVQVTWWVNPSGSRNLEYDPKKRIESK